MEPTGVTAQRKQLTEKQFAAIMSAQHELSQARALLAEKEAKWKFVSELVLDAHDLSVEQEVALDEAAKQLVITVAAATSPAPEEAPAPAPKAVRRTRSKAVATESAE